MKVDRPPMHWHEARGKSHSAAATEAYRQIRVDGHAVEALFVVSVNSEGWCMGAALALARSLPESQYRECLVRMRDYVDDCIALIDSGLPATSQDPRLVTGEIDGEARLSP